MNVKGISVALAGIEAYECFGFYVGRIILWGKGNRSLFAIWKDEFGLTLDIFWIRI